MNEEIEYERDEEQPESRPTVDGDDWYDEWKAVQLP
jgi:hypothetical protein